MMRRLPGHAILFMSLLLAASSASAEGKVAPVRPDFPEEDETCLGMEYDADILASRSSGPTFLLPGRSTPF